MSASWIRMFTGAALAVLLVTTGCTTLTTPEYGKDDLKVVNGHLKKGGDNITLMAFHTDGPGASEGKLAGYVPEAAHIAEVGGDTLCFDLAGFNEDATAIDPVAVATVDKIIQRLKNSGMRVVVRIPGDSVAEKYRKNAIKTAAEALKKQQLVAYWIDGPDAAKLTKIFEKKAPNLVTISEKNGDLKTMTSAPEKNPGALTVLIDQVPDPALGNVHFIMSGDEADYEALEAALKTDVEKAPWTPDNSVLSEAERKEGFISLFDGKTLDGWWMRGDNKKSFGVHPDGFIEWREHGGSALMTHDRYDNFILRMEWKIEEGGNSGVWMRAPRAARASKIGMELQMRGDSDVKEPGKDNSMAVYDVLPPICNALKPEGEWNDLEVIFDGPHFKATLNGKLVEDVNFDDHEELKYRLRKGFICLTDHDCYVGFRNIRIKKL